MNRANPGLLKIIDKLIFIFFLIFLLSLTNSIFANQIGYFGALLLILFRFFISRQNPFEKTGLELVFVLFIAAEFLSAIFSDYSAPAFTNAVKRSLLIPIIYASVVASVDLKRAKLFFKVYICASLVSVCIYLFFAYRHYIENLYGLTQSGPSIFQYPITASEIISFAVVFLFAFVINERTNFKIKLFSIIAFLLSIAALLSTYKRTGWTGAAFGIFIVLVMKKQWKVLLAGFAVLIILVFVEKNESVVRIIKFENGNSKIISEINTDGSAYDVYPLDEKRIVISDYENGLVFLQNGSLLNKIQTPAPVISFTTWNDNYYLAQLVDTRFLLIKLIDKELKITNEFISPGFTVDSKIANGFLYVLDTDSGLTVFKNPDLLTDTVRIPRLLNHTKIFVDSSKLVLHSVDGTVDIQNLKNFIPIGKPISTGMTESFSTIYYAANRLYGFNNSGLKLFDLSENNLKLLNENKKIIKVYKTYSAENKLFVMTTDTKLFEINLLSDKEIQIMKEANIGFLPASFCSYKDKLVTTEIKSSRLLSIFDPYNQTNLSRLALWRGGIEIFKNYPLFGVGDIGLENYYRQYKQPYNKEIQGHLHNNFFHILATLGLFGLLAVCFLFYRIIMINIKIYKTVEDESFISSYALGVIGAFFAFLVSGLTELNFGDQEIITLVWFTFGLNIAFYNLYKKQQNILTLKQD